MRWNGLDLVVERTNRDILSIRVQLNVSKQTFFMIIESHVVFDHTTPDTFRFIIFYPFQLIRVRLCTKYNEFCQCMSFLLVGKQIRESFYGLLCSMDGLLGGQPCPYTQVASIYVICRHKNRLSRRDIPMNLE